MAINKELQEELTRIDIKYKRQGLKWDDLPNDHPDILRLQELNPDSYLNKPGKRGPKAKYTWTEDQIDYFKRINSQYSIKQLAEKMGCTEYEISKLRKEHGFTNKYKPRKKSNGG